MHANVRFFFRHGRFAMESFCACSWCFVAAFHSVCGIMLETAIVIATLVGMAMTKNRYRVSRQRNYKSKYPSSLGRDQSLVVGLAVLDNSQNLPDLQVASRACLLS